MLCESILCKEILTDKLGNLHNNLLILGKRFLSYKLHNFRKVILLLKDSTASVAKVGVTGVQLVEVGLKNLHVLGVRNEPVKTGEMLTLGKLFIKSPKHLNNRKSCCSNRIGEITTGRRHSTDNGNSTLTVRGTKTRDTSSTLIESGKTCTKVCRITGIGRHLSKTSRNLTKGLGPTRGRVSHHRYIHTLITEVLCKGDTSVNRGLTSSHGHVGCVGHKSGTLHDTNLLRLSGDLIINKHRKLGEITQHFSHLISTLTTSDVNNCVGV
mmetsp:Transcript_28787/g.42781  ORF Transcript_28787/g.42781 Transcript_28787/m.42781 type:complete len:268 (+) Transcript_28787:614-1417(+)